MRNEKFKLLLKPLLEEGNKRGGDLTIVKPKSLLTGNRKQIRGMW